MVSYKRLGDRRAIPLDRRDKANKVRAYFWQKGKGGGGYRGDFKITQ